MNRSERRRQESLQGIGHRPGGGPAHAYIQAGRTHHQAGRFAEAQSAYGEALRASPRHPEALHLMGLLFYQTHRLEDALHYLSAATEESPSSFLYWFNLGVVSQKAGRHDKAIAAYEQAVSLNPRYFEAQMNLGNVLRDGGRLPESVEAYRRALALNPSHAEIHNNLAVALQESGRIEEAIASFRRAIELKATHVEAWNNLGLALMEAGTMQEAIESFQRALALMPGYQKALYNLGIAWSWVGADDKAMDCLSQAAKARHAHRGRITETSVYRSRIKHDIEQIQYLLEQALVADEAHSYLKALQQVQARLLANDAPGNRTALDGESLEVIAPSFDRILYCVPPSRIADGAVNRSLDVRDIETRYLATQPEVTYIDALLNEEALAALRRFCLEATIWKKDYENGYSGAFLGDGFASPLLFQIAEELRLMFPRIFKHHRLTQAWAFKHDSTRRGLNIHADAAAVNVNFWITPDDANLNHGTGGLVVYDKEAPKDWNFKEYNSDQNKPKILAWLKEVGAQAVRIPYRANRAVVFNSDLFHETDEISFKDEYQCRRINVTLLYGYRGKA
ncbi:MAG TPA: tetratricopeptide repeat protein [Nitrospira sp.]|nr:tetratricopeptide repeat protein [Nitrospira sp.]